VKPVSVVWDRKLLWLEETVLLCTLVAAVYGWLALPVATTWHLALHVLTAAGIVALIAFAAILARRAFGPLRWTAALLPPLAIALFVALGAPYLLLNWIPELASFVAQAISAALRSLLAAFLCSGALIWLWASASDPVRNPTQGD
jgi:hypothetical protein